MKKLLLFDLDGTLLRSDKTVSSNTLEVLNDCKQAGCLIGISTLRSEQNCIALIENVPADILVSSGGALIKKGGDYVYKSVFSIERTKELIRTAREICGPNSEITIDTVDKHYWNYKVNPMEYDKAWGTSIWTDYSDFSEEALKMCVEIFSEEQAELLKASLTDCDIVKFSDGNWYKITQLGIDKESVLKCVCEACNIGFEDIISFGDDYADIGMIKKSGLGVAMGNAVPELKAVADIVIGTNDEEGIAHFLRAMLGA